MSILLFDSCRISRIRSHGNMQQLDECNFIPDETLKEIAKDTLDIINFFDGLHLNGINELINPAEAEATA